MMYLIWCSRVDVEGNAKLLFDRISQISFYELTYSNNQKAIDTITHLFDAETKG